MRLKSIVLNEVMHIPQVFITTESEFKFGLSRIFKKFKKNILNVFSRVARGLLWQSRHHKLISPKISEQYLKKCKFLNIILNLLSNRVLVIIFKATLSLKVAQQIALVVHTKKISNTKTLFLSSLFHKSHKLQ